VRHARAGGRGRRGHRRALLGGRPAEYDPSGTASLVHRAACLVGAAMAIAQRLPPGLHLHLRPAFLRQKFAGSAR